MTAMQRTKGQSGEREVAGLIRDLTGWDVQRRVRNHAGDSDLVGVPGWSVEVKRHKTATRGEIRAWWTQACEQSWPGMPVLFYRKDRDEWRAVWSMVLGKDTEWPAHWDCYEWTIEGSVEAWAAVARDLL